jgi:transcriptional regulator MraZ
MAPPPPARADPERPARPDPAQSGGPLTSPADARRSGPSGGRKWQKADHRGKIGQPVFFGTFNHAIDAKGRTSLPAKFREALAAAGEPRIVLMQYPHWRAVQALPQSVWTELVKKVMEASPLDARWQRNVLKFVSSAHEVDLDVHGRVLVPPPLRAWASLQKDVVWVGMGRTIHLYDRAAYDEQMSAEIPADQVVDFFTT